MDVVCKNKGRGEGSLGVMRSTVYERSAYACHHTRIINPYSGAFGCSLQVEKEEILIEI
jgi:hypothetical protein